MIDVLTEMFAEGRLFEISLTQHELNDWNPNYFNGKGQYEGVAMNQGPGVGGDIDNHLTVRFNVGAAPQCLFSEVLPWYKKTQDLIEAQRKELDREKRLKLLEDLQKEMALQMPAVPWPAPRAANGFEVAWPFFENIATFTPRSSLTAPAETWPRYWCDPG
jgi:ABC-type transport system substrate-binding protein